MSNTNPWRAGLVCPAAEGHSTIWAVGLDPTHSPVSVCKVLVTDVNSVPHSIPWRPGYQLSWHEDVRHGLQRVEVAPKHHCHGLHFNLVFIPGPSVSLLRASVSPLDNDHYKVCPEIPYVGEINEITPNMTGVPWAMAMCPQWQAPRSQNPLNLEQQTASAVPSICRSLSNV